MKRRLISKRFALDKGHICQVPTTSTQMERIKDCYAQIRSGAYNLIEEACPCGISSATDVLVSEIDRYGLELNSVLCLGCGTIRINPYLDPPSVEHFYSFLYQEMYRRATDLEVYFERQRSYGLKVLETYTSQLSSGNLVIEVGCGAGGGLSIFHEAGYKVAGCDYGSELIAYGTRRSIPDLHVGGLDSLPIDTQSRRPALIYLHHVFEHVTNPLEFLRVLRSYLAPGGRALVIVPDIRYVAYYANPAGDILQFLHIAHKYNYSPEGLKRLGARAGLKAKELRGCPLPDRSFLLAVVVSSSAALQ